MGARRLTQLEFEARGRLAHGDKYDYSEARYVNYRTKVIIKCPYHGKFKQRAGDHIFKKVGCPTCANLIRTTGVCLKLTWTQDTFLQEANLVHNGLYTYPKFKYVNARTKGIITCRIHGDFEQNPTDHIRKKAGCPLCSVEGRVVPLTDVLKRFRKAHGDTYDYSLVSENYRRSESDKIPIICKIHGVFYQLPSSHAKGHGCPLCRIPGSTQKLVCTALNSLKLPLTILYNKRPKFLKRLEYDLFCGELNLAIELDGEQHYTPNFSNPLFAWGNDRFLDQINRDRRKEILSKENNITLHRIRLSEYGYDPDLITDACLDILRDHIEDLLPLCNRSQRRYLRCLMEDLD